MPSMEDATRAMPSLSGLLDEDTDDVSGVVPGAMEAVVVAEESEVLEAQMEVVPKQSPPLDCTTAPREHIEDQEEEAQTADDKEVMQPPAKAAEEPTASCTTSQFLELTNPSFKCVQLFRAPFVKCPFPENALASSFRMHYQATLEKPLLDWGINALVGNTVTLKAELQRLHDVLDKSCPALFGLLVDASPEVQEGLKARVAMMAQICSFEASAMTIAWWRKHEHQFGDGLRNYIKELSQDHQRLAGCKNKLKHSVSSVQERCQQIEYRAVKDDAQRVRSSDVCPLQQLKNWHYESQKEEQQLTAQLNEVDTQLTALRNESQQAQAQTEALQHEEDEMSRHIRVDIISAQELCNIVRGLNAWDVEMQNESEVVLSFNGSCRVIIRTVASADGLQLASMSCEITQPVGSMCHALLKDAKIETLIQTPQHVKDVPRLLAQVAVRVRRVQSLLTELQFLAGIVSVEHDVDNRTVTCWKFSNEQAEFGMRFKLQWMYPYGNLECHAIKVHGEVDEQWVTGVVDNHPANKGFDRITQICTSLKQMTNKTGLGEALYRSLSGINPA